MKYWKRILVLFLFTFTLLFPTEVKAQEKFNITNYDITIKVNENGKLEIKEQIDLDFHEYAHGFYRNIPVRYDMNWQEMGKKTYYFPVSNIDVIGDPYETNHSSDGVQIKIGDPDEYVYGPKSYTLSYDVQMRDLGIDQDYFYYNLIGDGFDCTIENVHFTIEFPKSFDTSKLQFSENVTMNINGNTVEGTLDNSLYNYQGFTAYLPLGQNYYTFEPIADLTFPFIGLSAIILAICFFLYFKFGRKQDPVITVEFTAPKGLSSAGVGYVIDGVVNNEDVLSLIIDFANRGYLTIKDNENPNLMELTKVREIDSSCPTFEKNYFNAIFKKGDVVTLQDLKDQNFGDKILHAKEQIYNYFHLKDKKVFSGSSLTIQIICAIFAGLSAGLLVFAQYYLKVGMVEVAIIPLIILWPLISASTIFWILIARQKHAFTQTKKVLYPILATICNLIPLGIALIFLRNNLIALVFTIIYTFLMVYMIASSGRRSKIGNIWLGQILGLKEFIQEAEKERLEMLVADDPTYFYSILPYAYVLGVSDVWSKKFEGINIVSPDWYYSSTNSNFNTILWMHHFNHTMHSFNSLPAAITPPKSGSGGFSSGGGGGFSGGGFGGGGGGSW